jgi:hypothetical protein
MKINTRIPAGCGKFSTTLRLLEESPTSIPKIYVFTREEIESLDLTRLLQDFSPENSKRNLRSLCSKWHFVVAGYDDDPEELYEIPAVRHFFSRATILWPAWTFGAATTSLSLWAIVLSVLPCLDVLKNSTEVQISFENSQVVRLFEHCLPVFTLLSKKAALSKRKGNRILDRVAAYLGVEDQ